MIRSTNDTHTTPDYYPISPAYLPASPAYSPNSPDYKPTSPAYTPTSPAIQGASPDWTYDNSIHVPTNGNDDEYIEIDPILPDHDMFINVANDMLYEEALRYHPHPITDLTQDDEPVLSPPHNQASSIRSDEEEEDYDPSVPLISPRFRKATPMPKLPYNQFMDDINHYYSPDPPTQASNLPDAETFDTSYHHNHPDYTHEDCDIHSSNYRPLLKRSRDFIKSTWPRTKSRPWLDTDEDTENNSLSDPNRTSPLWNTTNRDCATQTSSTMPGMTTTSTQTVQYHIFNPSSILPLIKHTYLL